MTIYIDVVIILNFIFDMMLLLVVNITLKRGVGIKRIILSSLVGEISIIFFLIPNMYFLIVLKIILAGVICIICFKYKDIMYTINNITYFYMSSIILGGFMYYLNMNNINYLVILLLSPLILIMYIKQNKNIKMNIGSYYEVIIYLNKKNIIKVMGFLDTGNRLKDPVSNKSVVLISKKLLPDDIHINSPIYVPYHSLNNKGLVKCIKPLKLEIDNKYYSNFLLGIMNDKIGISGVDCILNLDVMEGLHV